MSYITKSRFATKELEIPALCRFFQIGRTEQLKNTENPKFAAPILIDYFFEEVQKLKISIYDVNSSHSSLDGADSLGFVECNLGQVVQYFIY